MPKPKGEGGLPDNVLNPAIYKEAKKKADESYKRHSAYKSMYLTKVYKEMGGKYRDDNKKQQKKDKMRTDNWLKEEWIQIKPYVKKKEKIPCGEGDNKKACRPLKEIKGLEHQITMEEIIKKYGKKKVLALTERKMKDMDGRLDWRYGTFTPSKKKIKKI